jgi:trehalose 6-phosphate phosphatase
MTPGPPGSALTLPAALRLTAARAGGCGLFFDFDGTLAPIQDDPATVQPAPGVLEPLARLARVARRLAVVSARPVDFLRSRLEPVEGACLFGLYGLETVGPDGRVRIDPAALPWAAVVREVMERARRELPPEVLVEDKQLTATLHYRRVPNLRELVEAWGQREAERHGLRVVFGRMMVELRPPVERDKGDIVRELVDDLACAWYFGDDLSDLEAFDALLRRSEAGDGFVAVRVAVANQETGGPLAAAADLAVDSPAALPRLLDAVAEALAQPD